MNELTRLARRRPEVIIGIAAVLGFVLGQRGGLRVPIPALRVPSAPPQAAPPAPGAAGGPTAAANAAPPPPADPLDAY